MRSTKVFDVFSKLSGVYVLLVVFTILFLPVVNFISIDNILMPFVLVFLLFRFYKNKLFWLCFSLVLIKIGSELYSNFINDNLDNQSILWSFVWVKFFAVSWAALHVFSIPKNFNYMKKGVQIIVIALSFICVLQMLEIPHLSLFLQKIYVNNHVLIELNTAAVDGYRLIGTQHNPNNFAVVLLILLTLNFFLDLKFKYINALLLIILLLLTQSRTSFALLIVTLFIFHVGYIKRLSLKHMLLIVTAFLGVIFLSSFLGLSYLISILTGTAFYSNSFKTRINNVNEILDRLEGKWWFGYGKILDWKEFLAKSIDNEFAYEIGQYGIVGVVLFISFIIFIALNLFLRGFKRMGIIFLVLIALIGVTNLTILNHQMGVLFLLLPVLTFAAGNSQVNNQANK